MSSPVQSFRAAVVRQAGGPFAIEAVRLNDLRPDEVLVKVAAVGMCHTDIVIRDGMYPVARPIVLGHEGSGVVEAVGADVRKVAPGDPVVMSFLSCGACPPCRRGEPASCEALNPLNFAGARPDGSHALGTEDGEVLHDRFFGQSSFGAYAVAGERNVVKVRADAPLELLGPLGCGVQTGAGAVMNALKLKAGESLAVFGAGAVGLSAVMAAKAVGAATLIAVDIVSARLQLAQELGATHVVDGRQGDVLGVIREITGGLGVAASLETTGRPELVRAAVAALKPRGACAIVGASPIGTTFSLDMNDVMQNGKVIRGVVEGDADPDAFIPRLIDLYMEGRFPFDRLVRFYDFADINRAAADSEAGLTVKPVLRMGA